MSNTAFRDHMFARLREDLVGPQVDNEILPDRPAQRYSTGILYPQGTAIKPEEDEDGGEAVNEKEDSTSTAEDAGVSLHSTVKPATAGLSFAVQPDRSEKNPSLRITVTAATYRRGPAPDFQESDQVETPERLSHWHRHPIKVESVVELAIGEQRIDLSTKGVAGLSLYVLVKAHAGLSTVTVALSNTNVKGASLIEDEERHFFQVQIVVDDVLRGSFAPRPAVRAETDDDSRTAALIYREVKEYVVGHTCAAGSILGPEQQVARLCTEWVPGVIVPTVSDMGDPCFDEVRNSSTYHPLKADWLAHAPLSALIEALGKFVSVYEGWIDREELRVNSLPGRLRPQALKHVDRCRQGAKRMRGGIECIRSRSHVAPAFQAAQLAMLVQFKWQKNKAELEWRPFQLGFQLLVIESLADSGNVDRDIMDLLWFPTGGGKTEAYLLLTAFTILLRRMQSSGDRDAKGVSVLMRYTLRLLTIQQFQRAAAMILACELIRRRAAAKGSHQHLGAEPIGIGLWVGAAATPLTLRDALNRADGDSSTPEQLTECPCCGNALQWRITSLESIVNCTAEGTVCEFATTGQRLPVWTIDEEIYRSTPSLVIATVDKFAQIVRKPETAALFGRHDNSLPPDLIIQDELHLISGPLGSMAGLYEVAIDELCRRGNVRPKTIGSTATIRRAEDQISALFDRKTYQFPAPGINADNSGFAVRDDASPGRQYVGVTTSGRSATYMLQALTASLLQSAAAGNYSDQQRDAYWTLVTYFNSLRELGRALILMQDDVPISVEQYAGRHGETKRVVAPPAELTSRVRSYEIRDMLARLNKKITDGNSVDLLVASNMISVGIDIPRLGLMVVNAQPKTLSEYIQATSRVGRGKVPGLVITMYNSTRARDRSHFETFETWHRALYRDVEATSVTPFASRAQDKALHAVLVALVRHTIPGMQRRPVLDDLTRIKVDGIAGIIESRAARVDRDEHPIVSQKLKKLIDEWASRPDLEAYWDDFDRKISLLMSAEQFAAKADVDSDLVFEGVRRALWPTPNSLREVEAGTPFTMRHVLRAEGQ